MATKPDNHVDEIKSQILNEGSILRRKNLVEELSEQMYKKGFKEAEEYYAEFYKNKILVPPREASELYPQDYVDGYTQAIDDITAQFNSKGDGDE